MTEHAIVAASKLGRLLENRITTRFAVHEGSVEIVEEVTLCQAYGDCCFGIDHFIRFGTKQVHIQEKWESHSPKLRDIRHFIVASNALAAKLPTMEAPLRIYLSRRPVVAPESLFALQASGSETLSNYIDIEIATEELYNRVCRHFGLAPKALTPELIERLKKATEEYEAEVSEARTHRLQPQITAALKEFSDNVAPRMLGQLYGPQIAADIIDHIQSLCSQAALGQLLAFFKARRATATEYDIWIGVLEILRPIQVLMEQVNAETGRRIYSRQNIGPPAIVPTAREQEVERARLYNRNRRRAIITVIKTDG